ncbi:MAG: hypothetical protein VKL41_21585 [Snowella sp.]|nr:hypothetical protein [Snowella sp.]
MVTKKYKKIILEKIENEFLPKLYENLYEKIKKFFDEEDFYFHIQNIKINWEHLYEEYDNLVFSYGIGSHGSSLDNVIKIEACFNCEKNNINYECEIYFLKGNYGKTTFTRQKTEGYLINIDD